jgi:class III poly(R)-hydroxyalkanoic acid synthase PhaE subunit
MKNSSKSQSELFDAWFQTQKEFIDQWTESTGKFYKAFQGMDLTEGLKKDSGDFFSLYDSWKDTFGKYFDVMIKNYPLPVSKDTLSKLFAGADAYVKLYEFWEPLMKTLQERAVKPDSYNDLFDPSKYKEMIDKVFGFSSPETITEFYGQASKLIETWGSKEQLFIKPWMDVQQKNIDAYLDLASGDPDASMNIFHNMYSAFEGTIGKAFKLPAVGKDREEIELLLKTLDRYSVYLARNAEFQHKIYMTGQSSMEDVVDAAAKKVSENGEIAGFDEFFKLWTSTNEKAFLELFKTEEFSKIQGSVLDAALDARKHFHQLMELYLSDFPIALRSEMDDVYQTIYSMKRNVRELKKVDSIVEGLEKEMSDIKKSISSLQRKDSSDIKGLKKEIGELKRTVGALNKKGKKKPAREVTK